MRRIFLLAVVACGCNNPTYLFQTRPLETFQDPAAMGQGGYQADTVLYVVPVRLPTMEEEMARQAEQMALGLQQPIPWAGTRDFDIEIQYSIKNLESGKVNAFFTANGGSEFGDFDPALYVDVEADEEDQVPPPSLLGGSPIELAGNETKVGVFREDQVSESTLDLEAIIRYPAAAGPVGTAFQVLLRNSTASRTGLEGIPEANILPAWVRFQLSLSATGHVVCDYAVRVRDHSGKLAKPTDPPETLFVNPAPSVPAPIQPPAAMMMMN
jgi:hypothetical protein